MSPKGKKWAAVFLVFLMIVSGTWLFWSYGASQIRVGDETLYYMVLMNLPPGTVIDTPPENEYLQLNIDVRGVKHSFKAWANNLWNNFYWWNQWDDQYWYQHKCWVPGPENIGISLYHRSEKGNDSYPESIKYKNTQIRVQVVVDDTWTVYDEEINVNEGDNRITIFLDKYVGTHKYEVHIETAYKLWQWYIDGYGSIHVTNLGNPTWSGDLTCNKTQTFWL